MIDTPFAFAFAAGMLATVNPCGFAMLPAYLSWFLGAEAATDDAPAGHLRALVVGATVSAGFMAVFAVAGAILAWVSHSVYDVAPWITLVIAVLLVAGGLFLLSGRELVVPLPKLDKGGRTQGLGSMFVFGVSYAVASIGCTLPVFFATLSSTFRDGSVVSGLAYFVTYGLGMALVLMVLTLALSMVGRSIVHHVRRVLPYVNRAAGLLLVAAGVYVFWYGLVEIRHKGQNSGAVKLVTRWSADVENWIHDVGSRRLGLILALVVAVTVLVVLLTQTTADDHEPAVAVDGPIGRGVQRMAASPRFAKLAPRFVPKLDRGLSRLTGGRLMVSQLLVASLVLTTTGSVSGERRRAPLACRPEPDGSFLVVGSNFGRAKHPAWTTNLLRRPNAMVTYRGRTLRVEAQLLEGAERTAVWPTLIEYWPVYDQYEDTSHRHLRVFRLVPAAPDPVG